MGKQIKLPGGVLFNPETGEIQGGNFGRPPIPLHESNRTIRTYSSARTYHLWERFNNFISNIGDWLADSSDSIIRFCALGLFSLAWVSFAISIISLWVNEGFFLALFAGILGGGIFYYISAIAIGIFIWVANIVLAIIRYLFYNGYTFLIIIAIIVAIFLAGHYSSSTYSKSSEINTQYVMPQTTKYYCTARTVLNVRYAPRTDSMIIGSIKPNQIVEVYEITNGFAKIKYGESIGYASVKYLRKTSD